jgi:hypothetical protein
VVYVGKYSYIGNNSDMIGINSVLSDSSVNTDSIKSISEKKLSKSHKDDVVYIKKFGAESVDIEEFDNMILVDAKFKKDLLLGSLEVEHLFSLIKNGTDSFSITNGGNNEQSFSFSYSFTASEGVNDDE